MADALANVIAVFPSTDSARCPRDARPCGASYWLSPRFRRSLRSLTSGLPPFSLMNSTPANSKTRWRIQFGPAGSMGFAIQMNSHPDRGLREPALSGDAARRIPGRSVGDPMNSTPADSNAAFTSSRVDERLGGIPSTASKRLIVLAVTPAFLASCSVVQRRAFRAERICVPVII